MRPSDDPVDRLTESIKKLRIAYEKYFAGVERTEPAKERGELKQTLKRLMTEGTSHNTARRFRLQSLQASFITHEQYWDRVTRQIEEGVYRRDLLRLQRRQPSAGHEPPRAAGEPVPQDEPGSPSAPGDPESGRAAPGTRTAEPVHAVRGAAGDEGHPESIRRLYDALLRARAQTGESKPVSIDALAATVKKQVARVRAQHKCARVELAIAIKNGKAVLRAIPK